MSEMSSIGRSLMTDLESLDSLLTSMAVKVTLVYDKKSNATIESLVMASHHIGDAKVRIEAMEMADE